ncbi:uncharacterized protein Tco025E_02745 [Trypanosoma conorhini]|uniref:Uncharacterized protein n=1 Tax=Trypanosoma conorhini TaxID=83891 RepID=A0A3R7LB79_9TRYP|nr:uncharacterized protein Tco025E_02745 [Trypanosoma conorhini]RNF23645.1 hypothetical protein Tco025E_02745 [Trypanosoma conorhini]
MREAGCGSRAAKEVPAHDGAAAAAVRAPPEEDLQRVVEATLMEEHACLEGLEEALREARQVQLLLRQAECEGSAPPEDGTGPTNAAVPHVQAGAHAHTRPAGSRARQ